MAIINSNGVLNVTSIPTHTPTATQARLARLENTLTFYHYNGSAWITIRLDAPETYTGNIIPDNANLGVALQALENAIQAFTADGNHSLVTRTNATEDVSPTGAEVASPTSGDTADVFLTNGKLEKWAYTTVWAKAFTIDYTDVTNLSYNAATNQGTIESSNGSNAVIPLAGNSAAGLMNAIQKIKLDNITVTQPVDLDTMESDIEALKAEPTGYLSLAAATTALGAGKKFQYLAANLDGAVTGTVAWT